MYIRIMQQSPYENNAVSMTSSKITPNIPITIVQYLSLSREEQVTTTKPNIFQPSKDLTLRWLP